ncbi:MAG: hypothetical protein HRT44_08790 [Bdellovibrionales bacterium]|nr:hypothetical protein [Bdellovibrionales bacterium]NQZ19337.1 hypothetical protein [Bdellovibrionales bacterium]
MSPSQKSWYSSGFDLWVMPYNSSWYSQIDWWTQFFLSQNLDKEAFNKGQTYVVDVRRYLPNKKLWVYPESLPIQDVITASQNLAQQMGLASVRVFSYNKVDSPDEKTSGLQWSIVTED